MKTAVETIAATAAQSAIQSPKSEMDQSLLTAVTKLPRFSRTAIGGACWSVFGILAALFWLIARTEGGPGQTPTRLGLFLFVTLVPLGATSLFGTTILGWIAVSQIRRSAGRLVRFGPGGV